jgi:hypothetical protein
MACKGGLRVLALSRELDDDTGPEAVKLRFAIYKRWEEEGILGVPRQVLCRCLHL